MNEEKMLAPPRESVNLGKPSGKNARRFLCFLICCGILAAAFGISGVWMNRGPIGTDDESEKENDRTTVETYLSLNTEETQTSSPLLPSIPDGAIGAVAMDLASSTELLRNETVFSVNAEQLLQRKDLVPLKKDGPAVLILHTHTAEAYLPNEKVWLEGNAGDFVFSRERGRSVITVGERLCEVLNQNGISAIQCKEDHGTNGSLQGSYRHAAACISAYLKKYPSIRYVIDLHRDGILTDEGAPVGATVEWEETRYAQVMAVVGSEGNGTPCPNRDANLALALQLNQRLEQCIPRLCRPAILRNASYNQELAPSSLLLEIGSVGNTQEEAIRTAEIIGKILADLIRERAEQARNI